ncbi:MAG: hypothetical protein P8H46_06610 [Paracoccaceae bacterium]|nr:hypothetical protein [Paracoccaceae bacterium]
MSDWLYQVRIRVSESLSESLRSGKHSGLAGKLDEISSRHGMSLVCTYDAFKGYCDEAEENGVEEYALYEWTKSTIENPEKKAKHLKSFAFYRGFEQIYEKELALSLEESLQKVGMSEDLLEIKVIDSNPANNPQPPK